MKLVSTRFEAGSLPVRMGTADFSATSTTPVTESAISVTGEPVVSPGFEAGFLPLGMGTADFSVTGNPQEPATFGSR